MAAETGSKVEPILLTNDDRVPPWESKWLDYGQDLVKNSSDVLNEAAKYLVSIVSGVTAIYTGALGYLGITDKSFTSPANILLVIPFLLFLASIYFAVILLNPRIVSFRPDDIESIKKSFRTLAEYKYQIFKCCIFTFILAICSIVVLIALLPYIANLIDDKTMATFTVPSDNKAAFNTMGFQFNNDPQVTDPVELVDDSGSTYTVKISGQKIAFDKRLVTWTKYS